VGKHICNFVVKCTVMGFIILCTPTAIYKKVWFFLPTECVIKFWNFCQSSSMKEYLGGIFFLLMSNIEHLLICLKAICHFGGGYSLFIYSIYCSLGPFPLFSQISRGLFYIKVIRSLCLWCKLQIYFYSWLFIFWKTYICFYCSLLHVFYCSWSLSQL